MSLLILTRHGQSTWNLEKKFLRLFHLKDHQVHLDIHKQLKEPGNNTNKKQEIN